MIHDDSWRTIYLCIYIRTTSWAAKAGRPSILRKKYENWVRTYMRVSSISSSGSERSGTGNERFPNRVVLFKSVCSELFHKPTELTRGGNSTHISLGGISYMNVPNTFLVMIDRFVHPQAQKLIYLFIHRPRN